MEVPEGYEVKKYLVFRKKFSMGYNGCMRVERAVGDYFDERIEVGLWDVTLAF